MCFILDEYKIKQKLQCGTSRSNVAGGVGQICNHGGSRVGLGTEEVVGGVNDIIFKNPLNSAKNCFEKKLKQKK